MKFDHGGDYLKRQALPLTFFKGAQSVRTSTEIGSVSQYTCRRASRTTYDNFYGWQLCSNPNLPSITNFNSIPMKYYAVIHGVCGLYEGYSDTTCDWFPTKEAAQKHVDQCLEAYRDDEMCVNIDHDDHMPASTYVTMDRDPDNYAACVPSRTWTTTTTLQSTWTP